MADVNIEQLSARSVVGKRTNTTMATIGDDIGRLAGESAGALGPAIRGPCVTRYVTWEETSGEILVGFPVDSGSAAPPECELDELPAGRAAVLVHAGPYQNLAGSWAAIKEHMESNGLTGTDAPWEEYLDDCSVTPPEDLRTRIVWPIA